MSLTEITTKNKLKGMGIYLRYSPIFLGNEIIRQIKHFDYHRRWEDHKRVPLDLVNPDTYFDILSVYIRKNQPLPSVLH